MNKEFHIGDEFEVEDKETFKAEIAVFNYGKPEEEKVYYFTYWNTVKNRRITRICDKQFFCKWRNFVRNECRRKDTESRCLVRSTYFSEWKKCRENCEHCPYGKEMRDVQFPSLEGLTEKGESVVFSDASMEEDILDRIVAEDRKKAVARELAKYSDEEIKIITMFSNGISDGEIADVFGCSRQNIQKCRTRILRELREKLKDY